AAGWRVGYRPVATVVHVGGGSGEDRGGRRTPDADAAAFRTMAPLIRKHRPGARGAVLALLAFLTGEALLLASRVRRLAYS
ncbi:MAG: glycosyltransferase family 2 protein, partial [Miltoncostaeaceae bacterium]